MADFFGVTFLPTQSQRLVLLLRRPRVWFGDRGPGEEEARRGSMGKCVKTGQWMDGMCCYWVRVWRWLAVLVLVPSAALLLLAWSPPPSFDLPLATPVRSPAFRCPPRLGRVGILVIYTNASHYAAATSVVRCYAASRGYAFFLVNPFEDEASQESCADLGEVMFRKHCVAAVYLGRVEWLFVLDGDTAVVSADHCLEDYVDPAADLLFYERFFSGEIVSGNYVAKSSGPAQRFLRAWAALEAEQPPARYFFSSDNGAVHLALLRVLYPSNEALVQRCFSLVRLSKWPDWEPAYGAFLRCAKRAVLRWQRAARGKARQTSVRLRVQPRAQSFCRDLFLTYYQYWSGDFLAHGVKSAEPFDAGMAAALAEGWSEGRVPAQCLRPDWAPRLDPALSRRVSEAQLRNSLRRVAVGFQKAKLNPLFARPDFHNCWPHCPDVLRTYD